MVRREPNGRHSPVISGPKKPGMSPSQNRVGGDKAGHALQAGATQTVTQDGESATLVIGQTERPAAELGPERPVLLEEVVQSGRLAPVKPGGQGEVEPAERRRITHAVENSPISPALELGRLMGHYALLRPERSTLPISQPIAEALAPWQDILDLAYYSGWRKHEILGLTLRATGFKLRGPPRQSSATNMQHQNHLPVRISLRFQCV